MINVAIVVNDQCMKQNVLKPIQDSIHKMFFTKTTMEAQKAEKI